jgi:hypothetical protein
MKIKIILKESVDNLFEKAKSIFHYILSEMKKYVNKSPNSKGVEIIKKDNTYYVKLEYLNTNLLFVLSKGETATAHYSKIEENLHKIVMTTPSSSWIGIAELESVFIHEFTHFYENLMRKKSIFDDRKISHKTKEILKKYNIPEEVWLDAFAEPEINAFLTEFFEKLIQQVRYDMYKGDLELEISEELWLMKKSGRIILLKDFEEIILRYLKFTFEEIRQNYIDKTTENIIPIDLYFKILFSLRPVRMRKKKVINKLIKFITDEYTKRGSYANFIKGNDIRKRVRLNEIKTIIKENVDVEEYVKYFIELLDSTLNDFTPQQTQYFITKLMQHLKSKTLQQQDGYDTLKIAYNRIRNGLDYVSTHSLAQAASLSASDFRTLVAQLLTNGKIGLSGENTGIINGVAKDYVIEYNGRKFGLIKIK